MEFILILGPLVLFYLLTIIGMTGRLDKNLGISKTPKPVKTEFPNWFDKPYARFEDCWGCGSEAVVGFVPHSLGQYLQINPPMVYIPCCNWCSLLLPLGYHMLDHEETAYMMNSQMDRRHREAKDKDGRYLNAPGGSAFKVSERGPEIPFNIDPAVLVTAKERWSRPGAPVFGWASSPASIQYSTSYSYDALRLRTAITECRDVTSPDAAYQTIRHAPGCRGFDDCPRKRVRYPKRPDPGVEERWLL